MSDNKFKELVTRLAQVYDLNAASAVLNWDLQTYMPPGGAQARAEQTATLQRLAHEKFTSDEIGRLLEDLQPWAQSMPYDSYEASLVRVTKRDFDRARVLPPDFIVRLSETGSLSYQAWVEARPESDWEKTAPWLEKILDISREFSSYFPDSQHIADPLIDEMDYGMTASDIRRIFAELREQLVPIVDAVTDQPPADDSCLRQPFPEADQLGFSLDVVSRCGYDLRRGRQDKTAHPFTTRFSMDDVRITTRVDPEYLGQTFFSSIHEAGHAMYEQGIDPSLARTPLANGTSAGVHESQSRLWENIVGRSLNFWTYFYPQLQARFPTQFGNVSLDTFHRAINKVERSLIRTEADELTYNLHIMLRFDFEVDMLEGKLPVRDLPDAWAERIRQDLQMTPDSHSNGAMQDVHWYGGIIGGAFQGYTLGNIMSALFYRAAERAHSEIPDEITKGEFGTLLGWLRENVYRHGSKFTAPELVERATGGPIVIGPYIDYLKKKYGELYKL